MPNAAQTTKNNHGSSRNGNATQIVNLFRFPATYDLGALLQQELAGTSPRGNRCPYSHASMLAVVAASRVCRSLSEALRQLWEGDTWEQCRAAHEARCGVPLPVTPPTRDQVLHFRKRVAEPSVLMALKLRFRRLAVGQARALGNLAGGVEPDWANPDERHTIYGDGVIIAPYSDVTMVTNPVTKQAVALGSRAASPQAARVQRFVTDTREDGKQAVGINFVAVHTWTKAGGVVLGTSAAKAAEQWTALRLIESIAEFAGDGIHTVLWDRAVRGWCVDYLMGTHRIQVIGEAVGRKAKDLAIATDTDPADEQAAVAAAMADPLGVSKEPMTERTKRLAVEHGVKHTTTVAAMLDGEVLSRIYHSGAPQPVGTCLYPERDSYAVVFSKSFMVAPAEHQTQSGTCRHDLVVDDGGLYTVAPHPEAGYLVKTGFLGCTSSRAVRHGDRWGTVNTYTVPCTQGSFTHTRAWTPDGTRHTQQTPKDKRRASDQVGHELRPLSRRDRRFHGVFSRRNHAESYNSWVQQTTQWFGRAGSEDPARQELDFLAAALLNNSETWDRRPRD